MRYGRLFKLCTALWKQSEREEKNSLLCTKQLHKSRRKLWMDITNDRVNGEPHHQPPELLRCHGTKFVGISGPGEVTAVYSFVKKQEPITLP